jgi:hypothetical protein
MTEKILGISFCTRMIGLVVVESNTLIHHSMKVYKGRWGPQKLETILASLTSAVRDYNIDRIVLSIAPAYTNKKPFTELWTEIVYRFRNYPMPVYNLPFAELQKIVHSDTRHSREALMNTVVKQFPELTCYARVERRIKNKYYYKLFEAAGACLAYSKLREEELNTLKK